MCYRVIGTFNIAAKKVGKPTLTIRMATKAQEGMAKVKIWRFTGKDAWKKGMKWLRNGRAGDVIYNSYIRKSVDTALTKAAGLGIVTVFIKRIGDVTKKQIQGTKTK